MAPRPPAAQAPTTGSTCSWRLLLSLFLRPGRPFGAQLKAWWERRAEREVRLARIVLLGITRRPPNHGVAQTRFQLAGRSASEGVLPFRGLSFFHRLEQQEHLRIGPH